MPLALSGADEGDENHSLQGRLHTHTHTHTHPHTHTHKHTCAHSRRAEPPPNIILAFDWTGGLLLLPCCFGSVEKEAQEGKKLSLCFSFSSSFNQVSLMQKSQSQTKNKSAEKNNTSPFSSKFSRPRKKVETETELVQTKIFEKEFFLLR